jgi:hypothetical protein
MGIIQWWNDRKRSDEPVEIAAKPSEIVQEQTTQSDYDRVSKYGADGGHIVDLTNKPRKENDGFAPDHELLTSYNRAHQGTRDGINSLMRR